MFLVKISHNKRAKLFICQFFYCEFHGAKVILFLE